MMPGAAAASSEDCLTLNIWTPGLDDTRRPVLVWVHGGGFVTGACGSEQYTGEPLALRGDVVVVTINYRLGVLGYLADPALADPDTGAAGNWGLLDQIRALEWIRDNAIVFGGDPGNVTIFGESAGAMSVSDLVCAPAARGLFSRAIVQSGNPSALTPDEAARTAREVRDAAGVSDVSALRDVPVDAILAAQQKVMPGFTNEDGAIALRFQPAVDGSVLTRSPWDELADGVSAGVPVLVGTNRDEMALFAMMGGGQALDDATVRGRLERILGSQALAGQALERYTKACAERGAGVDPRDLFIAIESDRFFRAPAMRFAEVQSRHDPRTFTYLFTWEIPGIGAGHAMEIPFVFGTLGRPGGLGAMAGSGPEVTELSERMQDAWIAFARTGDPSHPGIGSWPGYEPGRRATMVLGASCGVQDAPMEPERAFWDGAGA